VAVILVDGRSVLLAQRNRSYAGAWCIPCGYVEWDEDVRAAAARELAEETGLEVAVGEVVAVHSNVHDPHQHTVGVWFAGSIIGGTLRPGDDAAALGWFDVTGPLPELAFPTDATVLANLSARLR
jgi:ADP-ribose pyrophosphatase YjhB (NUDIX family)